MPSQTAGSARAPVFGHAPTASESGHTWGKKKNSGDGKGEGGERERGEEREREGCNIIFSVQDKERQFTTGGE